MSTVTTPPILGRLTSRSRPLTNSAAEFLELRGDEALGAELAEISPEFVPELDHFVTRDSVPPQDYYSESQERVKKFKETLAAFQKNLVERKVDERYDIEIKDAGDYTLVDVLKIAQVVQQRHKDADKVHSCMGRIKKFFRATGRNASTYKKLLAFVPDDAYGSVICGGFTVILGTLERLETLRADIYSALGSIPKTMRKIHDLLDVHYQSPRLKYCGDSVLVAIFALLELIIRELSGSLGKKIIKSPFKGDRYGSQIDEAIEALDDAVKDFESEAKICDAQRLGQVDVVTKRTLVAAAQIDATARKTEEEVRELSQGLSSMTNIQEQFATRIGDGQATIVAKLLENTEKLDNLQRTEVSTEKHGVQIHNTAYYLFTASPFFDTKTGKMDHEYHQKHLMRAGKSTETKSFSDANKSLLEDWKRASGGAADVVEGDLDECLRDFDARSRQAQMSCVAHIVTSGRLKDLLRSDRSKLLIVDIHTDPEEYTAASYATAVLVNAIRSSSRFPVLYHFCARRDADPENDSLRGTTGLFVSLIVQLLVHLSRGAEVDLEFLNKATRRLREERCKVRTLRKAFEKLVELLPRDSCVYICVDSLWKLENNLHEEKTLTESFLNLARKSNTRIKIVVTEPSPLALGTQDRKGDAVRQDCILTLQVPSSVENAGLNNTSWIKEEAERTVIEYTSSQINRRSNGNGKVDDSSTEEDSD